MPDVSLMNKRQRFSGEIQLKADMRAVVTDNKLRTGTVITELSIRTMIAFNGITVGSFVKINIESPCCWVA